jgi:acyl transferase domain-containing protein
LLKPLCPVEHRCKSLDAAADGYVRAEACTTVLLAWGPEEGCKLAATAVNQDGRSSSLTAPNGPSQREAITEAVERAGLALRRGGGVSRLGLHGTGTPLGDPIEVGAAAGGMLRRQMGAMV